MKCFGANDYGQLGLGTTEAKGKNSSDMGKNLGFVNVGSNLLVKSIALGENFSCAILHNGKLKCWGSNAFGTLGSGDLQSLSDKPGTLGDFLPEVDLGAGRTAKEISAKKNHICAILDNNRLKCWGAGTNGMHGLGNTQTIGDSVNEMGAQLAYVDLGANRTVKKVSTGFMHTCVILDGNQLKCFGDNSSGQLGLGDVDSRGESAQTLGDALPYVNLGTDSSVLNISLGGFHSCAIMQNRQIKCWGFNSEGQLGLESNLEKGSAPGEMGDQLPSINLGSGRSALSVSAGRFSTCAILDNHQVKCWGSNEYGQLGTGNTLTYGKSAGTMGDNLPYVNLGSGRSAKQIACGEYHACALLDNDEIKCWGKNTTGQLGQGDTIDRGKTMDTIGDMLFPIQLGF